MREPLLLRSDNALTVTVHDHTRLLRSNGLRQEFFTRHCPLQNAMVEQTMRTLKVQCAHRHHVERESHAQRVIEGWSTFYCRQHPLRALEMMTPDAAYAATSSA